VSGSISSVVAACMGSTLPLTSVISVVPSGFCQPRGSSHVWVLKSNVPSGDCVVLLRSSSNSACRSGGAGVGVDVGAFISAAGCGEFTASEVFSTFVPHADRAATNTKYFADLKNFKNNFLGSPSCL